MRRVVLLTLVLLVATGGMAAPAVAQENVTNSSDENAGGQTVETPEDLLYQMDNGLEIREVEYENGSASVHLVAPDQPVSVSVGEGALEESGGFSYQSVRLRPHEERVVSLPVRDEAVVVTSGDDGFYHEGQLGITVLTNRPTDQIVQMGALSGVSGSVLALGVVVGMLKRRHKNTYKELYSQQRHKIESDPVEGVWEFIKESLTSTTDSKWRIGLSVLVVGYVIGAAVGMVSTPGQIWGGLNDSQRLIVVGSIVLSFVAAGPIYMLVKRIWSPDREFVLDLDSKDVYRAADGDKSGSVATYSAPPERVENLDVDGSTTTISTPGGRAHLVRGMDPEENTASGNPPHIANDLQVAIAADRIEANRQDLQDLANIGRDIMSVLPTLRTIADANAVRDIDAALRDSFSAGGDSLDRVLKNLVEGTDYEGTYSDSMGDTDSDPALEAGSTDGDPGVESGKDGSSGDSGGDSDE